MVKLSKSKYQIVWRFFCHIFSMDRNFFYSHFYYCSNKFNRLIECNRCIGKMHLRQNGFFNNTSMLLINKIIEKSATLSIYRFNTNRCHVLTSMQLRALYQLFTWFFSFFVNWNMFKQEVVSVERDTHTLLTFFSPAGLNKLSSIKRKTKNNNNCACFRN